MQSQPTISRGHLRWSLGLLCVISTLNFVDRQIVTILTEPIKHDLKLSDLEIGTLNGIAFVAFYCLFSLPAARIADRYNRPRFLALAVGFWSAFTALCGYAGTFFQLAAARAGVAVGESAGNPTAHSLISDLVPATKRAGALAIYNIGTPLGALFGMAIGGMVADQYGWRMAFFVVGIPGILVAILTWMTLPEPRQRAAATDGNTQASLPWGKAVTMILRKPSFVWLVLSIAMFGAVNLGLFIFVSSFFLRTHAAEIAALGAYFGVGPLGFLGPALGLTAGITGTIGGIVGGRLTDHYAKRDIRANLWIPLAAMCVSVPIYLIMLFVPSALVALLVLSSHTLVMGFMLGPLAAAIIGLAPKEARATAASINLIAGNLVGVGLGPILIGGLSDFYNKAGFGLAEGLRYSLATTKLSGIVCIFALLMAARTYKRDYVG